MSRITDDQAFEVCDVVETDYNGKVTKHIIAARFKVRNSQTGVVYEVVPTVPKSKEGDRTPRIDHAWFRRIGRLRMSGQKILYEEIDPRRAAPGNERIISMTNKQRGSSAIELIITLVFFAIIFAAVAMASVYQCHAQWEGSGMKSEYRLGAGCNGKQKTTAGVVLGYKID